MRFPEKLDSNLHAAGRMDASSMRLTLRDNGPHSCSFVCKHSDVKAGDWCRVWTPQGEDGVYVVRSVDHDFSQGLFAVSLDHAISILSDTVVFDEVSPATISGDEKTLKIGVREYVEALLDKQDVKVWRLGRCDYTDEQGWSASETTLLAALQGVMVSLEDWLWTYEMDELPFTLNIIRKTDEAACEMRAGRNLASIRMTVDRSGMCTRIYPSGASGLTIEGVNDGVPYLEKNVDVWGRVARVETEDSIEDADLLKAWAQRMLDRLSAPIVTVNATGLALVEATGESLDRLTVGTRCRVPLPAYNTVITERITQLSWIDAIGAPEHVSVVMANNPQTTQGVLRKIQKTTGGGGSAGASQKGEKNLYTIVTHDDKTITNIAVAKRLNQTAISKSIQTADSIQNVVARYEYDDAGNLLEDHHTTIEQNADWIKVTGKAIFDDLYAEKGKFNSLMTGNTTASSIIATNLRAASKFIFQQSELTLHHVEINGQWYFFLGHR